MQKLPHSTVTKVVRNQTPVGLTVTSFSRGLISPRPAIAPWGRCLCYWRMLAVVVEVVTTHASFNVKCISTSCHVVVHTVIVRNLFARALFLVPCVGGATSQILAATLRFNVRISHPTVFYRGSMLNSSPHGPPWTTVYSSVI